MRSTSWFTGCLAVLMIAGLAACGSKSTEESISDARRAMDRDDVEAAIINLKTALSGQPSSVEARVLLAKAMLRAGDGRGAAVELHKLFEQQPQDDTIPPLLARALNMSRQHSTAISELGALELQDNAAKSELRAQLAIAYMAVGKRSESASAVQAALEADPKNARALVVQSRLAIAAGRVDQALSTLDTAAASDPKEASVAMLRGLILHHLKHDSASARAAFRRAVELDPRSIDARSSLVAQDIIAGDLEAARSQLKFFKALGKDNWLAALVEAQIAFAAKNLESALQHIELAQKQVADNFQVNLLAGMIQLQKGMLNQAERSLSTALRQLPSSNAARQNLAQVYMRTGQVERALQTLEPLLASNESPANVHGMAGAAHMRLGDLEKAATSFVNAVRADPKDPTLRTQLALAQAKSQPRDKTVADLKDVSASDPGIVADLALVNVLLDARDLKRAMEAVDVIERKAPTSPMAHNLRGFVLIQKKELAQARKSFERALELDPKFFPATTSLAGLDVAAGRTDAATQRYEAYLKLTPNHVAATLSLAKLLEGTPSSHERIVSLLTSCIREHPNQAAPRVLLVDRLLANKDPKAALSAAQDADAALPNDVEVLGALGRAQYASGQRQALISTYAKVVGLVPGSAEAHTKLAGAYLAGDDRKQAELSLRKALSVEPDFVPAQQALIAVLQQDKRFDQALVIARTAQKQRPDSAVGYVMAGAVELNRGQPDAAAKIYREGLQRVPDARLAASLYSTLAKNKREAEAENFASEWLRQRPKDMEFLAFAADLAMSRTDLKTAERYFRAILEIQPDHVSALNNVAWIWVQQNRRGGLKFAERANQLRPDTPGLLDTLALAYALEGDLAKALETQKKAVALAPGDQGLRLHLARIMLQRGDRDGARTELLALQKLGDRIPAQSEVERLLKQAQ